MKNETYYLISIDPGKNLGVVLYEMYSKDHSIKDVDIHLYTIDNYIDNDFKSVMLENRLKSIHTIITDLCKQYDPLLVSMENAFMDTRFATAVVQLSQYIATIKIALLKYNPDIKIFGYPPKYVKRFIGAGGNAKKDDMTKAINKIKDLKKHVKTDGLSEHEIDSIAIGYIAIEEIRKYPHLLYSF